MKNTFYSTRPKDEKEAQERADILSRELQRIFGCVWTTRVHENSGWHYSCFAGTLTFYTDYVGSTGEIQMRYNCLIADKELTSDKAGFGSGVWSIYRADIFFNEDPSDEYVKEVVYPALDAMVSAVTKLEKIRDLNVRVFEL